MLTTAATLSRAPAANSTPLGIFADKTNGKLKTVDVGGTVDTFVEYLWSPYGLVKDTATGYFVAEQGRQIISQITAGGVWSRYAGVAFDPGFSQGVYPNGKLWNPTDLVKASNGDLYCVCQSDPSSPGTPPYIAKIAVVSGNVTISRFTFIQGGTYNVNSRTGNYRDWKDGTTSVAMFGTPRSLCIDSSNNLYFTDYVYAPSANPAAEGRVGIRKITSAGVVSTLAYYDITGEPGVAGFYGLGCATDGTLYFSRQLPNDVIPPENNGFSATPRIYQRSTAGVITQIAGSGKLNGNTFDISGQSWVERDGTLMTAAFEVSLLRSFTVNSTKTTLYTTKERNLRRITISNGVVAKIAGNEIRTTDVNGTGSGASFNEIGPLLLL